MLGLDRRSSRNPLGHRREDFDALDGIDAQVRLQVHVQPEGLGRIAGFLGNDGKENRRRVGWKNGRNGNGNGDGRGNGTRERVGVDKGQDLPQGPQSPQMLRLDRRGAGYALGHRREDFHALDGIDAQVRLQVHVQAEGLGRIAGFLGDNAEENRCRVGWKNGRNGDANGNGRGNGTRAGVGVDKGQDLP